MHSDAEHRVHFDAAPTFVDCFVSEHFTRGAVHCTDSVRFVQRPERRAVDAVDGSDPVLWRSQSVVFPAVFERETGAFGDEQHGVYSKSMILEIDRNLKFEDLDPFDPLIAAMATDGMDGDCLFVVGHEDERRWWDLGNLSVLSRGHCGRSHGLSVEVLLEMQF